MQARKFKFPLFCYHYLCSQEAFVHKNPTKETDGGQDCSLEGILQKYIICSEM